MNEKNIKSTNATVANALAATVANARVTSVRDFNDLLNGIEEDIENPGWGWDKRAERKLLDELKPFAMQYGKMSDWQRVDSLLRRAANSANATVANALAALAAKRDGAK